MTRLPAFAASTHEVLAAPLVELLIHFRPAASISTTCACCRPVTFAPIAVSKSQLLRVIRESRAQLPLVGEFCRPRTGQKPYDHASNSGVPV